MSRLLPSLAMATIRTLAENLGVSPATVSRSLKGSTRISEPVRRRVVAEAERIGYRVPERSDRSARTSACVGIAFANHTSNQRFSGYDGTVWSGVARAAASVGCSVKLVETQWRQAGETWSAWAKQHGIDVLVLRTDAGTHDLAEKAVADGVPTVVVADWYEDERIGTAYCDSATASYAAVEHLLELGHRRIALVHNQVADTDHLDRIEAYQRAMIDHGVEPANDLRIVAVADIDGGAAAINRLLSMADPPTAAFFCDPLMTVGALQRSLEVGLHIPDEFSVVGVDDDRIRRATYPTFTSVCQNAMDLAYEAGRWASEVALTPPSRRSGMPVLRLRLDAILEINQSTGPPPANAVRLMPNGSRI